MAETVGTISRSRLATALPDQIEIRKGKNGKLYMVSPWSAWYMNSPAGQDLLRQAGEFDAEPKPAGPSSLGAPAPDPVPATREQPSIEEGRRRGFFEFD